MAKRLVPWSWSASAVLAALTVALLLGPPQALAASDKPIPPMLSQGDREKPQDVIDWLQANEARADKATARKLFELGTKHKQRKDWGGAIKGFGDSAAFYPSPRAFIELAEAELHMLRDIRRRTGATQAERLGDVQAAADSYGYALAADSVLQQLTSPQRQRLEFNVACMSDYLKTQVAPDNCPPLVLYGVAK